VNVTTEESTATEEENVDGSTGEAELTETEEENVAGSTPGETDGVANGAADGVANGAEDGGDIVTTRRNDAVLVDNARNLMRREYFAEQARLGNSEAAENITKKVVEFARTEVFRKQKFWTMEDLDREEPMPKFVIKEFVEERKADSKEVTARRQAIWWSEYKSVVTGALTRRRAEVMGALKKKLVGKSSIGCVFVRWNG